jgi:cytochrome b561
MPFLGTRFRYGAAAQVFHWLTVILVVTAYFMGPGGSEQRVYSSAVDFTRQTYETLGVTVLALVFIRLLWRLIDTAPEDPPMKPMVSLLRDLIAGVGPDMLRRRAASILREIDRSAPRQPGEDDE